MLRHPGYTRERIAQVGDRIRALIHADAVALRRDQHVIAHGVQPQPAERTAIGGRLAASHRTDRPPSRLFDLCHGVI